MKNNRIPFGIRRKIVSSTTVSGWTAPHAAYVYEADATGLLGEFKALNGRRSDAEKTALNTLLTKIVVEGVKADPRLNAHVHFNKWLCSGHMEIMDSIDVNTPLLLPSGEMVTVKIPGCGAKSLSEMERHIRGLMSRLNGADADTALLDAGLEDTFRQVRHGDLFHPAGRILGLKFGRDRLKGISGQDRDRHKEAAGGWRLCADDVNMGTVTISNLGALVRGTAGAPALIDLVSPQALAVGIGAIQDKPGVPDPHAAPRKTIPFCIVFDHRALDFGHIAKMVRKMDSCFSHPEIIHDW